MVCLLYSQNRLQLSPRHLSRQYLSEGHLSISAISQLLLARFGSNFRQRVLVTYATEYNCPRDIFPGNICSGDIFPYQQYLSCYWHDLDQILNKGSWEHVQQITNVTTTFDNATFVLGTFVHISNIFAVTDKILEQIPTIKLTFVQATFVLATFVHIRNISAVTEKMLDQTLNIGS